MTSTKILSTGNSIVDEIATMNFSGNITPEIWYHTIVNEKDKPNLLAITILSDVVYWYRPTEVRSEDGTLLFYKRKFAAEDFLQRNYDQIATRLNVSKRQAKDAIILLEDLGVLRRHFRSVKTPSGILSNVMYIELIPDRLRELTFPDTSMPKNSDTYDEISSHLCTNKDRGVSENGQTYTENTTEITTEISTTTMDGTELSGNAKKNKCPDKCSTEFSDSVVDTDEGNDFGGSDTYNDSSDKSDFKKKHLPYRDDAFNGNDRKKKSSPDKDDIRLREISALLDEFHLPEKDILSIARACDYDCGRCESAVRLLKQQTKKISNVTGWLISALRNQYHVTSKAPDRKRNDFCDYPQRHYSEEEFEEIERRLLGR